MAQSYWIKWEGIRFPIRRGETTVGRSAYCSIVLNDPSVSREHAAVRLLGDQAQIADLESRNGTTVNGERLGNTPHTLREGDVIVVGAVPLQFLVAEEDASPRKDTVTAGLTPVRGDEDATTQTTTASVELIESLIARALASGKPVDFAATVRTSINDLLTHLHVQRRSLSAVEAERLAAAANVVASWPSDRSLTSWYNDALRIIEAIKG